MINLAPVPDFHYKNLHCAIFDAANDAVVTDAIFPETAEARAG